MWAATRLPLWKISTVRSVIRAPELLFGQGMGNRIVMLGDLDMVVEAGAALLPFGVLIGLGRQRLERRSVECFEQFPAGRAQMLCLPPVQVFQPFMDGLVSVRRG